jgi:6-phosphogluconolactonase
MAELTIAADEEQLAASAADLMTSLIEDAITTRGNALVCLAGGTTPRRLYTRLGDPALSWRARIDWSRLHLFWGDERLVPPDHPDSNFGRTRQCLLAHVPVRASQIHRMRGELQDAGRAAADYEQELHAGFAAAGRPDTTFDVMLLGVGQDAHIASIFPGSPLLTADALARPDLVAAVYPAHLAAWRLTLTPPAILDTRRILVLAAGPEKAAAVHAALYLPEDLERWPAQLLHRAGDRVQWILDKWTSGQVTSGEVGDK